MIRSHHNPTRRQWWAIARFSLAMMQMGAATVSAILLLRTGLSEVGSRVSRGNLCADDRQRHDFWRTPAAQDVWSRGATLEDLNGCQSS